MTEPERQLEVFVWLSVESDKRAAEDISSLIGLNADRSWKIGDFRGRTKLVHRLNGWAVDSRLERRTFDPEAHIDDLMQRVRPYAEKIQDIAVTDETILHCVLYTNQRVAVHLPVETLAWISRLGAALDLEIYFLPDD